MLIYSYSFIRSNYRFQTFERRFVETLKKRKEMHRIVNSQLPCAQLSIDVIPNRFKLALDLNKNFKNYLPTEKSDSSF